MFPTQTLMAALPTPQAGDQLGQLTLCAFPTLCQTLSCHVLTIPHTITCLQCTVLPTMCHCLSGHQGTCIHNTCLQSCLFRSCPNLSIVCNANTLVGCGPISVLDCGGTIRCGISSDPTGGVTTGPEMLATLKAQLQGQLKAIEEHERMLAESSKPKSLDEAEALEKQLTEQLEMLRAHKASLKSGAAKK